METRFVFFFVLVHAVHYTSGDNNVALNLSIRFTHDQESVTCLREVLDNEVNHLKYKISKQIDQCYCVSDISLSHTKIPSGQTTCNSSIHANKTQNIIEGTIKLGCYRASCSTDPVSYVNKSLNEFLEKTYHSNWFLRPIGACLESLQCISSTCTLSKENGGIFSEEEPTSVCEADNHLKWCGNGNSSYCLRKQTVIARSSKQKEDPPNNTSKIAGGVAGAVGLLGLLALATALYRKIRKASKVADDLSETELTSARSSDGADNVGRPMFRAGSN